MAVQQNKGKMSFAAIVKARQEKEINYGQDFGDLPPGISNGIAKFVQIKRGQYKTGDNKGEDFIYIRGVVETPKTFTWTKLGFVDGKVQAIDTVTTQTGGMTTSQLLAMCQTKKANGEIVTQEENLDRAFNEIEKLFGKGVLEGAASPEDLDPIFEELSSAERNNEHPVYFKFSTSKVTPTKDRPDPRPFENWYGTKGLENYVPEDAETYSTDAVSDAGAPKTNGKPAPTAKPAPASKPAAAPAAARGPGAAKKVEPEPEPDIDPDMVDKGDIDSLLALANDGDDGARQQLHDMFVALPGKTEKDYDKAQSWEELYAAIKAGGAEAGGGGWVPVKEDVYRYAYAPIDPKTKKAGKKVTIEVEVTAVDAKAETVKIKSLLDPKQTFTVKWDELIKD